MDTSPFQILRRLLMLSIGALLSAFTIRSFVYAQALLPGGFTGLVLLVQESCQRFGGFHIPFAPLYFVLNFVPAAICFRYIGKRFTLYSLFVVVLTGLFADWMPPMFIAEIRSFEPLLSSIFGGLLGAVAISICLHADATAGGTDFIAIFISEKFRKDAWNYIFAGNCVILAVGAYLFSLDKALYSIILQFVTTVTLGTLYRNYQQRTLIIITNKPDEIYKTINEMTHHGATYFEGHGSYEKKSRTMLYSVVSATQVKKLIPALRKIDNECFINVLKTEQLNGKFIQTPRN